MDGWIGFGSSNYPSLPEMLREFPWWLRLRAGVWLGRGRSHMTTGRGICSLLIFNMNMTMVLVKLLVSLSMVIMLW